MDVHPVALPFRGCLRSCFFLLGAHNKRRAMRSSMGGSQKPELFIGMAIRMLALQNVQAAHRRLRSRVRVSKATHADKKITSRSFGMLSFAITLGLAMSLAQAQQPTLSGFQVQQTQSVQATADEGELPSITVTGYLIPRVGEGPQPVLTLDR